MTWGSPGITKESVCRLSLLSYSWQSWLAKVKDFLEKGQRLANKKNGFQLDRSCLDHIFTLSNGLHITKVQGGESFDEFVNLQKALIYIDHDFLLYKLYNKSGI